MKRRPAEEVSFLMQLFMLALEREVAKLHKNNIRFRVIGDLTRFEPRVIRLIAEAEQLTRENTRLTLTVAANYGGRWDMIQAVGRMLQDRPQLAAGFTEADLQPFLSLAYAPEPDFFIRTGGFFFWFSRRALFPWFLFNRCFTNRFNRLNYKIIFNHFLLLHRFQT